jgi:hypothetical protein
MALVIQSPIVGAIILFAWGALKSTWEDHREVLVGKLFMAASVLSLACGTLGLATVLR